MTFEDKLKKSKFCFPSKSLVEDGEGIMHFTVEGYNLLVEILEEKASKSNRSTKN